jgi:hypothetical protein
MAEGSKDPTAAGINGDTATGIGKTPVSQPTLDEDTTADDMSQAGRKRKKKHLD